MRVSSSFGGVNPLHTATAKASMDTPVATRNNSINDMVIPPETAKLIYAGRNGG
jgi:hypothetical protein